MNDKGTWNKARIRKLLSENDRAVCRAMIVLLERQTQDEQSCGETKHHNSVGFSGAHSRRGTYYGKWCKSGKMLTGEHLDRARKIALRYAQQLADEANSGKRCKSDP